MSIFVLFKNLKVKIFGQIFIPNYQSNVNSKEVFLTFTKFYRIFGIEITFNETYLNNNNIEIYGNNDKSKDLCRSSQNQAYDNNKPVASFFCSTNLLIKYVTINFVQRQLYINKISIYALKSKVYSGKNKHILYKKSYN